MDAAGPAVVNGMVFANSGYGQWGGIPGNVIGTHSEDHPLRFEKLSRELVEWEIDKGILDVGAAQCSAGCGG
jgi:hypothetical protein